MYENIEVSMKQLFLIFEEDTGNSSDTWYDWIHTTFHAKSETEDFKVETVAPDRKSFTSIPSIKRNHS